MCNKPLTKMKNSFFHSKLKQNSLQKRQSRSISAVHSTFHSSFLPQFPLRHKRKCSDTGRGRRLTHFPTRVCPVAWICCQTLPLLAAEHGPAKTLDSCKCNRQVANIFFSHTDVAVPHIHSCSLSVCLSVSVCLFIHPSSCAFASQTLFVYLSLSCCVSIHFCLLLFFILFVNYNIYLCLHL